jgi:hypothetical protein
MTQFDKIKEMSIEEMAKWLEGIVCCDTNVLSDTCGQEMSCNSCVINWLNSEVKP